MKKSITKRRIESSIDKVDINNLEEDFVACTVAFNETGIPSHSGLLICFEEELYYFHYSGKNVELTNSIPNDLYYQRMDIIPEILVASFLWHCEKLSNEVKPIYGFNFDESYYDSQGEYYLQNQKFDITTCVGFCIKVLTGFLRSRYLELNDWESQNLSELWGNRKDQYLNYLINMANRNELDYVELIENKDHLKRILPIEMFTSSFYTKSPIRKEDIDLIIEDVEVILKKKYA